MDDPQAERIDELTLALLSLGLHRRAGDIRAWKSFDDQALMRLHKRGLISSPKTKNKSVVVTSEGVELARALLDKCLDDDRALDLSWPLVELEVELVDEWSGFEPLAPRIWRRFRLRSAPDVTLFDLHQAIQDACGWLDYHLHAFFEDAPDTRDHERRNIAMADMDRGEFGEPAPPASHEVLLSDVLGEAGDSLLYEYDFGDSWHHRVSLVGRANSSDRVFRELVDGARAFPPEDVGGLPGYERAVQVARAEDVEDVDDLEIEELQGWLGDWSPDIFDLEASKRHFDAQTVEQVSRKRKKRIESTLGY